MQPKEQEIAIGELEERVDRLRILYDQYFLGFEKLEPLVPRKDVERRFMILRKEQIRNTAMRFRFNVVNQKYNTYSMYWIRIARQIEEGTYKRHLQKAKKILDGRPRVAEREDPSFEIDMSDFDSPSDDIDQLLAEADAAVAGLERGAADTVPPVQKQMETPVSAFRPAAVDGHARPRLVKKGSPESVRELSANTEPTEFKPMSTRDLVPSNRDLESGTAVSPGQAPRSNRDVRVNTTPSAQSPASNREMLSRTAPSVGVAPPPSNRDLAVGTAPGKPPSNKDLAAGTAPMGVPPSNRDLGAGTSPGHPRRFVAAAAPESAPRIQLRAPQSAPGSSGGPPQTPPVPVAPRGVGSAPRVVPAAPVAPPPAAAGPPASSQGLERPGTRPMIRPRAASVPDLGPETPRVASQPRSAPAVPTRTIAEAAPTPRAPATSQPRIPVGAPAASSNPKIVVPPAPVSQRNPAAPATSQPRIAVPAPPPSQRQMPAAPLSEPGKDSVRPSVRPRPPLPSTLKKDPPKKP